MRQWLIGLTKKTADNLDIKAADYPAVFDEMMADIEADADNRREMALLLWCGAATLTIRGSQKSRIGKSLERVIARAALASIGLSEERGDFRLNVVADEEVERETDAEVQTPRGFVRLEVGLIAKGNSEVIGDKVGRMDRNDVILMDQLPPRSVAYRTAENRGVLLVQIRNGHAVEELRKHLAALNVPRVRKEPIALAEVEQTILDMPLEAFGQD